MSEYIIGSGDGAVFFIGALSGDHEWGARLPGALRDGRMRALEMERLPIWELSERNLEGGLR